MIEKAESGGRKVETQTGSGLTAPALAHGGSPARWARNSEQIARVFWPELARKHPRLFKRRIEEAAGWTKEKDFPRKTSKGWAVQEIQNWESGGRKVETQTGSGLNAPGRPGAMASGSLPLGPVDEALLNLWEDKLRNPGAWLEQPIQKWQLEMLKLRRPELFKSEARTGDSALPAARGEGEGAEQGLGQPAQDNGLPEPRVGNGSPLPPAESQRVLATVLAKHFSGRIRIDISEQQISNWKGGVNLPQGAPLPPTKLNNRHDSQGWADWIERWIMPTYGRKGSGANNEDNFEGEGFDVFQQAQRARAQREIDDAAITRMQRLVEEGRYRSKEVFEQHLRRIGSVLNGYLTEYLERRMQVTLEMAIDGLPLDGAARWPLLEAIRRGCREAADGVREDLKKMLLELND